MTPLSVLTNEETVNEYLKEHDLENGYASIDAILLQMEGTSGGRPCAMIAIIVDGKRVLAKTSLRLFVTASRALEGVTQDKLGPHWQGQ